MTRAERLEALAAAVTSVTENPLRGALKRSYAEGIPMSHNNAFGIHGYVSRGFEAVREAFAGALLEGLLGTVSYRLRTPARRRAARCGGCRCRNKD
jgi:hypothetical protein